MTTEVNAVFDAFVAAKAAIDKVPELEHTITSLTANLNDANGIIDLYKAETDELRNAKDQALAQQRSTEEALEKARKSNEELEARFNLLMGTLRDLGSSIGSTLAVVTPEPVPFVEESPSSSTEPSPVDGVSVSSDPSPAASTAETPPLPVSVTSSEPEPLDAVEAHYKNRGETWFDKAGNYHNPNENRGISVSQDPTPASPKGFAPVAGPEADAPVLPVTSSTPAPASNKEVSASQDPFAASTASPSPTASFTVTLYRPIGDRDF